MDDRKSYAKPLALGEVMAGESVCELIASNQPGYAVGDIVLAPNRLAHARGLGRRNLAQAGPSRGAVGSLLTVSSATRLPSDSSLFLGSRPSSCSIPGAGCVSINSTLLNTRR
jgi:NADPH-dependent curcumin reductase CurA